MARHGWPQATEQRKKRIQECVQDFLNIAGEYAHEIDSWDGELGKFCVNDEMMDFLDSAGLLPRDIGRTNRFATQIQCCIRAGLDVAANPSAGVMGFNVGTLRRM